MSCSRTRDGPRAVTWHYLGAVQRNKVGRLAPFVDVWQAVGRVVEGEAIMRHCWPRSPPRPVGGGPGGPSLLVEVDTTAQAGRGGCAPGEVPAVVAGLQESAVASRG